MQENNFGMVIGDAGMALGHWPINLLGAYLRIGVQYERMLGNSAWLASKLKRG